MNRQFLEGEKLTKDELKHKLRSAWVLQQQIDAYKIELQNLRDNVSRITPAYRLVPGGSGTGQRIENAMAKIVDIENNIKQDIEIQLLAIDEIHCLMAVIEDPLLKLLIHKRYILYEKWEKIAVDLNYSWKQIHRLHNKVLNIIVNKV